MGGIVFDGRRVFKKSCWMGGVQPPPPQLWETPGGDIKNAVWHKTLQQKEVVKKLSHVVKNLCLAL